MANPSPAAAAAMLMLMLGGGAVVTQEAVSEALSDPGSPNGAQVRRGRGRARVLLADTLTPCANLCKVGKWADRHDPGAIRMPCFFTSLSCSLCPTDPSFFLLPSSSPYNRPLGSLSILVTLLYK